MERLQPVPAGIDESGDSVGMIPTVTVVLSDR
jgi:hypothetical protein